MATDWPWPDPPGPKLYGIVRAAQLACPQCGELSGFGPYVGQRGKTAGFRGAVFTAERSIWACPACHFRAYVGLVLWPVSKFAGSRATAQPADHVLSPGQALELRSRLSYVREGKSTRRAPLNGVCTCASGCLVHGRRGNDEESDS